MHKVDISRVRPLYKGIPYDHPTHKAVVDLWRKQIREGCTLPPLKVIGEVGGGFAVKDGHHRLEAYRQEGITEIAIVCNE
jgi:hypothetical protein